MHPTAPGAPPVKAHILSSSRGFPASFRLSFSRTEALSFSAYTSITWQGPTRSKLLMNAWGYLVSHLT